MNPRGIEYVFLKYDANESDVKAAAKFAKASDFRSVCVFPRHISALCESLEDSGIKTVCAVGFPFGQSYTAIYAAEAALALSDGAEEIDFFLNSGEVKSGGFCRIANGIATVSGCGIPVNAYFDGSKLDKDEIYKTIEVCAEAKAASACCFGISSAQTELLLQNASEFGIAIAAAADTLESAKQLLQTAEKVCLFET